jgi:hypothetical protein
MTKEEFRALNEFDRARTLSVFVILKNGDICGRLTARHIKRTATSHIAFIIYGYVNNGNLIAGYERISGLGFNREDFGIDYLLQRLQERLKNELGIEFTGNTMLVDHWKEDFQRAGFQVIQAL